jgi:hypothetical protein
LFTRFNRQNVRLLWSRALLDERRQSSRQSARVERIFDANRPALMEIVEQPSGNTAPIVKRHDETSTDVL